MPVTLLPSKFLNPDNEVLQTVNSSEGHSAGTSSSPTSGTRSAEQNLVFQGLIVKKPVTRLDRKRQWPGSHEDTLGVFDFLKTKTKSASLVIGLSLHVIAFFSISRLVKWSPSQLAAKTRISPKRQCIHIYGEGRERGRWEGG